MRSSRSRPSADGAANTPAWRRPIVWAIAGLAAFALAGGLLWSAASHGPSGPTPGDPFAGALDKILVTLGLAPDLPAEWAVDRDQVAKAPAQLHVAAGLGELPQPFQQDQARQALDLYHEGRLAAAAERAEKAWAAYGDKKSDERTLFAFLLTQLRMTSGNRPGALAAARIAATHPSLGLAAVRFLAARADDQGLGNLVLALSGIGLTSSKDRDDPALRLLRARALRRSGQTADALAELDRLQAPNGTSLARKVALERMRLAHARGREDEAVQIARQLTSGKSAQAEEAVDFLLGSSDPVWQQRLQARPDDGAAVLDALVYTAQRRRYARAIPALEALAAMAKVPVAVRCHARSWAAKAHDRKAELDKSIAIYPQLAKGCDVEAVQKLQVDEDPLGPGEVAYRHGRALLLQGKDAGVELVKQAVDAGLGGPDGDDARTLLQLAKAPDAMALFKQHGVTAAQDYAERDIVDVVAWRVAMERMTAGKWKEALPILDRMVAVRDVDAPGQPRFDDRDWARGRADYFAGRALQVLGKDAEAQARWRRVVQRHPLTYYATMAQAQLQAVHAPAELGSANAERCGPQPDAKILNEQGVMRARLLGQLGWHDEAGDELDALGLGRDVAADQRWAQGDPGGAWTRAALDDEAGRWIASHAAGRDQLRRYATAYPGEGNRAAWQIAYPRAFRTLIEAAAKEFGLHPSIVWAICRSESGFNPRVESHAAAIGLLQLILPTAQAMAKPLGLTADAQTLRQPPVNVRLGARYLKLLLDRFDREAQMAAGYNAGGGAVGRWRKQRGDWPMDLFVESIPFRETRDYAKRVLSSIAVYRNLYDSEPLHTFALTQKPVPVQEEVPTEPSSTAHSGATSQVKAAHKPAAPVVVAQAQAHEPKRAARHRAVAKPAKAHAHAHVAAPHAGRHIAAREHAARPTHGHRHAR